MMQEEKQLLLKDLCARLPYGVICQLSNKDADVSIIEKLELGGLEHFIVGSMCVKPYLRPMSSMNGKEWVEYCDACLEDEKSWVWAGKEYKFTPVTHKEEFLNSHHFDYRGLILMGLALEAPEGMYNKEESEKGSEIPIPKTVDEAISTLEKILSEEDREYLLENGAISMHDSLGRWIRNEWGLWTDSELKNELKKKGFEHPDDMSNYIIEEFIKYWNNKI